jgi:hypothetical protein
MWVAVPMAYEKWVNPANKNDKHYRALFRNITGRRYSKTKFKTATEAMQFSVRFYLHLCPKKKEGNDGV